jgi:hypothetical protein
MRCYPNFTILKKLFFPDWHGLFQRIYDVTAGFKSSIAVRGRYGNNYRYFANLQRSCTVMDKYFLYRPFFKCLFGYLCISLIAILL